MRDGRRLPAALFTRVLDLLHLQKERRRNVTDCGGCIEKNVLDKLNFSTFFDLFVLKKDQKKILHPK